MCKVKLNKKVVLFLYLLAISILGLALSPTVTLAQERSYFQNSAQAQKSRFR
jgi:hypothetical protein